MKDQEPTTSSNQRGHARVGGGISLVGLLLIILLLVLIF